MDYKICLNCPHAHENELVFYGKNIVSCNCAVRFYKLGDEADQAGNVLTISQHTVRCNNLVRNELFNTVELTDRKCDFYTEHMMHDLNQNWLDKILGKLMTCYVGTKIVLRKKYNAQMIMPIFILGLFIGMIVLNTIVGIMHLLSIFK